MKAGTLGMVLWAAVLCPGCADFKQYRTDYTPCLSTDPAAQCPDRAIQEYQGRSAEDPGYLLGFIEFDDQGQLFDRKQAVAVIDRIDQDIAGNQGDAIMVVFVHGWKHNAAPHDDNVMNFGEALRRLGRTEAALSARQHRASRKIVGLYIGWRGASITAPILKELTFWDRKNTAHKVGHGGLTEVLTRLDDIRLAREAEAAAEHRHSRTRLVVVGHSFGGGVVYSAVSQILQSRFVSTVGPAGTSSDVEGFGNLVVLVNPAFEASLYAPLSDLSTERPTYFSSQLPLLAILTSEADQATGLAFPVGRWFSTRFEKERLVARPNPVSGQSENIDQRQTNVKAVGHFEPFRTHRLSATSSAGAALPPKLTADQAAQSVIRVSDSWEHDEPGSEIAFPGTALRRTTRSAGRDPYLLIQVDKELIPNHNDIWDERISEFIAHLVLVSGQSGDLDERQGERALP